MFDLRLLGERIAALRDERGLTLQQLATRSSVSVSMVSSVERGEKAPTVVVLARIADGLGVSLTELIQEQAHRRVIVRRAAEHDRIAEPGGWHRTVLSPVVPGVNFEWIRSELPPGCTVDPYPAYAPGSHEYVVVESGALLLTIADQEYGLAAGDSVYFAADATHGYANPGAEPCRYLVAALIMRPRRPAARGAG